MLAEIPTCFLADPLQRTRKLVPLYCQAQLLLSMVLTVLKLHVSDSYFYEVNLVILAISCLLILVSFQFGSAKVRNVLLTMTTMILSVTMISMMTKIGMMTVDAPHFSRPGGAPGQDDAPRQAEGKWARKRALSGGGGGSRLGRQRVVLPEMRMSS